MQKTFAFCAVAFALVQPLLPLQVLAQSAAKPSESASRRFDLSKRFVEMPVKKVVSMSGELYSSPGGYSPSAGDPLASGYPSSLAALSSTTAASSEVISTSGAQAKVLQPWNRTVSPGLVAWRKDFDTACRQAKKSGKPVLLFQMMGELDHEFC